MSTDTVKNIMVRIKGSAPDSKIAIFKSPVFEQLDAVFHETIKTKQRIASGDKDYVGSFDGTMNAPAVEKTLMMFI